MPVFVFDAYGTLFDVHAAMRRYRAQAGADADRMSELWRTKQLEYSWTHTLSGTYVDFWTLTQRALDYAMARFPATDRTLRQKYLDAYLVLEAFPDANETLRALKSRGHRTAILSNGTPDMLHSAVHSAGMAGSLDEILSVDSMRMFKPRQEVYQLVTDAMKITPADVIFTSSNRWDVMGARVFGFRTAWVNRSNLPDEYPSQPAERVIRDLHELLQLT